MGKGSTIRILVVGPSSRLGVFLGSLEGIPGVEVAGILDACPNPEGLALAKRKKLPVYRCQLDCKDLGKLHALVIYNAKCMPMVNVEALPEGLAVLQGVSLRLIRRLAGALKKAVIYRDKFQTVKQTYDQWQHSAEELIGKSEHIEEIKRLVRQVAPTPTPVLLLGETGTGKDLAARAIHHNSAIKDKPFIAINCTALAGSLMESELFGYRKGAFTGADEDRKGLFEEADGGTLFLDEIGDMPLDLQSKLLRFLQTGEVRRVGSTQTKVVRVRVIAATNRNMEQDTAATSFRRDLYYRINTFTIRLHPLRERRKDIPYLAYHFLTRAEAKLNKRIQGISDEALACLTHYDWPGNVRELGNVIERAVILCQDSSIQPLDLPQQVQGVPDRPIPGNLLPPDQGNDGDEGYALSRERIMASFERKELLHYLKNAHGNVSEACRVSGIPRRTFYRKMRKHGL